MCNVWGSFYNLKFASTIHSFKWAKSVIPEMNAYIYIYIFLKALFQNSTLYMAHYCCSASSGSFVCALNSWTQNCRKNQILRLPKVSRLKHESFHTLILFISCKNFKDYWGEKTVQRVLVSNFVEISKDFLIFIDLKTAETNHSEHVWLLNKSILLAVPVPQVHVNTLNYEHIFYPVMNISKSTLRDLKGLKYTTITAIFARALGLMG